ncbi:MAG: adenylate kinase [SAR202 cluster bacterium]|nr:adenylate kinase [SAR202 cluster bacterium]
MAVALRIVLFGPPGAGKGTQAQMLKDQLGLVHISSGDLFRKHLREGTPLGQEASRYIKQGALVPDSITIGIMLEQVLALPQVQGFMLDGFPRNPHQAEALEKALNEKGLALEKVVAIQVPEAELVQRLGGRYTCRSCQAPQTVAASAAAPRCPACGGELYQREDDAPAAIKRRIEVYRRETVPVLDFYRNRRLLVEVAGVGTVQEVNERVLKALGRTGSKGKV